MVLRTVGAPVALTNTEKLVRYSLVAVNEKDQKIALFLRFLDLETWLKQGCHRTDQIIQRPWLV